MKHKWTGDNSIKFYDKWLNKYGNLNCVYCKSPTMPHLCDQPGYHPRKTTIDHVIPRSKGGSSRLENLVLACEECNKNKGNSLVLTS